MNAQTALLLGYKKAFDFKGRSTQPEFWWLFLQIFIFGFLTKYIPDDPGESLADNLLLLACVAWMIVLIFCFVSVSVRRAHDSGKSGWWALPIWIPLAGLIVALYIGSQEGDAEANQYGKPFLANEASAVKIEPQGNVELELGKIKDLLDSGLITSQEADKMRSRVLHI